eukprot:9065821-Pyramimonas_sp.AAC.1
MGEGDRRIEWSRTKKDEGWRGSRRLQRRFRRSSPGWPGTQMCILWARRTPTPSHPLPRSVM